MSALELKKFNMNMIKDDKVVVLIGKRETGKSFLVKDLLYHHKDIPVGTVISGTEGANAFYSKLMPSIFIHGEFRPELIANVIKRQQEIGLLPAAAQMTAKAMQKQLDENVKQFIIT